MHQNRFPLGVDQPPVVDRAGCLGAGAGSTGNCYLSVGATFLNVIPSIGNCFERRTSQQISRRGRFVRGYHPVAEARLGSDEGEHHLFRASPEVAPLGGVGGGVKGPPDPQNTVDD